MLFLISVILILLAAVTVAWFASNQDVDSSPINTSVSKAIFDLGVVESGGARAVPVDTDALTTLSAVPGREYSSSALETTNGQGNIICALLTDDGNPIRPGSTGTLVFRILPHFDNLTFTAEGLYSGIKKVLNQQGSSFTFEFMDPANDADDALALDLLEGHILFFTSGTFSPASLLDITDGFVITGATDFTKEYLVTLYWTWPRIHDRLLQYTDAAWRSAHTYLYNGTGDTGYNNADQVIGERVAYTVIELDLKDGSDPLDALPEIAAAEIPAS